METIDLWLEGNLIFCNLYTETKAGGANRAKK